MQKFVPPPPQALSNKAIFPDSRVFLLWSGLCQGAPCISLEHTGK